MHVAAYNRLFHLPQPRVPTQRKQILKIFTLMTLVWWMDNRLKLGVYQVEVTNRRVYIWLYFSNLEQDISMLKIQAIMF